MSLAALLSGVVSARAEEPDECRACWLAALTKELEYAIKWVGATPGSTYTSVFAAMRFRASMSLTTRTLTLDFDMDDEIPFVRDWLACQGFALPASPRVPDQRDLMQGDRRVTIGAKF